MKHKLMMKCFFISTLLVTVALCLLGPPFDKVHADPPEPTSSPAMDIRTRLQPYQTPSVEPSQADGQLFEVAPLPSEVEEPPIGPLAQQTFYCIADATVLQGYPSQNLGHTADMWAGYDEYLNPDGRIARSLVRFNITSLPPNATITEATLRVRLVSCWDYPNTSRTITTYRITSSWSESSVTWNNRPGYGSAYGSRSIVSSAWGWYEFDVTNLVRAWYNGTYTNYGIMLRGPEVSGSNASWRGFGTRESSYDPQLVVEYDTIPAPPSNLTATPVSQTQINLAWQDNSSNETGFKIERSPNGTTGWTQIATVGANVTTYPDTGLTCNTRYYYRVRAYNASGDSNYSNTANATTSPCSQLPAAPSNLTATPVSQTQINLAWQDNSNNETGFKIERSPNGTTGWAQIATVGANVTTYANTGLTCSTKYYYRVRAYNASGDSNYSNTANATTSDCSYSIYLPIILKNDGSPPPVEPPSTPVLNPINNSDGDGNYTVSWSSVSGATGYVLQEDDNSSFTSPTTVYSGVSTSKTITGRGVGTYYYRVQATNSSGSSPWSNVVSVQVKSGFVPEPGTWYCYPGSLTIRFTVSSDSSSVSNGNMTASCGSKSIAGPASIENGSFTLSHSDGISFISATFDEVDEAHGSFGFWVSGSCWAIGNMTCTH